MYAELNYMHCECVVFVYIELNYTVNVLYLYILNSFALMKWSSLIGGNVQLLETELPVHNLVPTSN